MNKKSHSCEMAFLFSKVKNLLTAPHTITTIQALITSTVPDSNMTAGIAGGRITLHAFCRTIYRIKTLFR